MSSSSLTIDIWPITDAGRNLTHNTDFVAVFHPHDPNEARISGSLYVIADAGEQAQRLSRYAAHKVMYDYYNSHEPDLGLRLRSAIEATNWNLHQYFLRQPEALRLAKVALVAAVVRGEQLHVGAVGNARAYLVRAGGVQRITHDHTLVQQLVDEGALTPEQANEHPRRDVVTRSLGAEESVEIDLFDLRLKPDDALVLCSDGLTRHLSDEEIGEAVSVSSPRAAAEALVNLANDRGGKDNVSIVATLVREGAPRAISELPHQWAGQHPAFEDEVTTQIPRAAMPQPPAESPPTLRQRMQPVIDEPTPIQPPEQPVSPPPGQPTQLHVAPPPGYAVDPATGLPPVPTGYPPAQAQPYAPRIYRPPAQPGRRPRGGFSLGWVVGAAVLAVALTAIMVLILSNPFGWELPTVSFGGREAAASETAQAVAQLTIVPTATPPLETIQPPEEALAEPSPTPTLTAISPPGMVLVEGGVFIRGVTEEEATAAVYACIDEAEDDTVCIPDYFTDAQPVEEITLSPFFIDITEVTNVRYAECVGAEVCSPPSDTTYFNDPAFAQHPVVYVNWDEAQTFCEWAGGRLPTESEWEKAARGTDGRVYPWGDEWASGRANTFDADLGGTSAVQAFAQDISPYGVLGMSGNVSEWVADWYFEDYDNFGTLNPTGPERQPYEEAIRVARGGSFLDIYPFARTGHRLSPNVDSRTFWLGFRCVMDVEDTPPPPTPTPEP